jgi:hypothetical protein
LRIWQVNQPDYGGDLRVDFTAGPDPLRVRRQQAPGEPNGAVAGIAVERLDLADFRWLLALAEHATLAAAIERAGNANPAFDLQTALHRFIGDGTVAGIVARSAAGTDE